MYNSIKGCEGMKDRFFTREDILQPDHVGIIVDTMKGHVDRKLRRTLALLRI